MRCALVVYLSVVTKFVVVYSLPKPCEFIGNKQASAYCGRRIVGYTLDVIPPISQDISYIDMQGQPLKQLPYNGFRNLSSQSSISTTRLRDCQISHVDPGALLNLHNLTVIDLSHNDISQIDSRLFSDTKHIEFIYMAHNKIEVVPSGLFQNLILLEGVYLQHNQIHQVEKFSFQNTPSLRIFTLSNNQIQFLNMSFKDKFDNLTYLSLHGNPWRCNCELGPLYEFLIKINILNQYPPVCDKPSTLHGRDWSDISRDEFVCRSEVTTSTQDSVMTGAEPLTPAEQDDTISATDYNGRRYQQVDTSVPQSPSNLNWILYTMLALVLVGVIAVIIGVVFVVRYTRAKSNTRRRVRLPTIVKRRSFRRTNARQMAGGIRMHVIHSSAGSEDSDSGSSTADVAEEQTSIKHDEMREATSN